MDPSRAGGWIELSPRSKLLFAGPQALWFLDQLITNKVDELGTGEGAEALVLSPNGKITAQLAVMATNSGVFVDAGSRQAQDLLAFFTIRVFATKVQISDVGDEFALIRVVGDHVTETALQGLGIAGLPKDHLTSLAFDSGFAVRLAKAPAGLDLWIRVENRNELLARLDQVSPALPDAAYEDIRVAAGAPIFAKDFDETFLPQEAAMERAVHFQKGCYLGQEAVAMTQRGRIKRRLRHLHFDEAAVAGTIFYDQLESGTVTSTGTFEGAGFGIATVKTAVPVGARVEVAGGGGQGSAVIKELPGTTEGPKVPSARELREALKGQSPGG